MHIAEEVPLFFEILDFFNKWYRTKLRVLAHNADYFIRIIKKLKTCVYNSNSKIMYNLYVRVGITVPLGGKNPPFGGYFPTLIFLERTPQNTQNCWLKRISAIT